MEHIGRKIKIVRELHNFTQEYVAKKLNMQQANYAKLEAKAQVDKKILDKIANEVYGIESEKIINLPTDPKIIIQNIYDNNGVIINISGNIAFNKIKQDEIEVLKKELDGLKDKIEQFLTKII